ncbi:hypothetical protein A3Q56_00360 [Intoshia linei]|uniref:Uncharacterized protein n=1 Tax=Intoshia linei TaxID=1819745 RepID=A0A177BE59_9BILA|nr:hypothetical protein A3Q56_00360 [Intoshia linei]
MLKRGLGRRWKFRMQEFKMYKKISENGLLKYLKLIETRQVNSVEQLDSYTSSITKIETFEDESIMSSDGSIVTPSYESEQYVEKIDVCVGTKIETAEKALQVFNYKFEKFLHIKLLYPVTEDVLEKVTIKIFNEKEMIDETSISPNNDENDESNKDHDDIDKLKNIYNERENYSKVKLCIDEYIKNNQEICVFEGLKMELYESDQEDVYAHIDIDLDDLNLLGFPVTYTLPHNRDGMEPVVPQYFGLDVNAINENEISMIAPIKFNLLSSISNRPIGKIAIIFYCEYRLIPDYWNHEIGLFDEHDESITEEESIDEQVVEEIEEEETKQVENQELLLYKKKFDEMENLHRQKIEILKNDHRYEYKLMTQEYESTISDLNKKITSMNKQIKKLEKYKKMNPTKGHVLKKSKSPLFISPQLKNSRNINIQNQINDSIYSNNINYKNDELFEDVNPLDEIYVTLKKRNARSIINGFLERLKRNQENSMKLRNKYFQSIKKSIRIATEKSLMNQYKLQPKFIEYGESCIKDVSIPALFMPNPNPNQTLIYNPRLYKFFHSLNTTDRLTQLPAINKMRHSKSDASTHVLDTSNPVITNL